MAEHKFQSKFLKTISARGFIHQCTDFDGLDQLLHAGEQNGKPVVAYIGFDCTAPSLHVGSLIQIMMLYWFQQCGHKPIVLMGGGTTKIGDPSGKDASRQLLDDAAIQKNMDGIKQVFSKFMKFESSFDASTTNAVMVNNDDWLKDLNYISFLRDYGRHFSVNRMLTMDSVKLRLERESYLSFLEFNYMVLQAYDFAKLKEQYGCRLQIGGSDQYGNIITGVNLEKRIRNSKEALTGGGWSAEEAEKNLRNNEITLDRKLGLFGLTTPLLTTSSGAKMGKTADGAVWLNGEMFSAYDYWQFWRNAEDADVARFLKLFTDLPHEKINELSSYRDQKINDAKKALADAATALLHGEEAAKLARKTAEETFEQGLTSATLPEATIPQSEFGDGLPAHKLFQLAKLADSGKEARRLIEGGGAMVQDEKLTDANKVITLADFQGGALKLSAGKKRHVLVKLG